MSLIGREGPDGSLVAPEGSSNVAGVAAGDPFFDDPKALDTPVGPGSGLVSLTATSVGPRGRSRFGRLIGGRSVTRSLFAGLVVLNLLDLVSTRLVLDRGGEEGNPVMAPVVHNIFAAAGIKALCLAMIWTLLLRSRCSPAMLTVVAAVR